MALIDDRASARLILSATALIACAAPASAQIANNPNAPGYVPGPPDIGRTIFGPQFAFPVPALRKGQSAPPAAGPGGTPTEAELQAPAAPPAFFIVPRGALEVTATDNVGVTNTNPKGDIIFSPSAGFYAQAQTARTTMRLDGSASYDVYTATPGFNGARFNGIGDIRTNLLDRSLEVDGRFATSQEQISVFGPTPASARSFGQNQLQVLNYGVTPTFRWRMGDTATGQASYDFSGINYFSTTASNSPVPLSHYYRNSARVHLAAGPSFDRLTWELDGSASREDHAGYFTDRGSGAGSLLYAVRRNVQLVATVGYDEIDDPTLRGASGLYATGGTRWALSPRTHVELEAGERYRKPYYSANVEWRSRRILALHARYAQGVDTPQSVLTNNLLGIFVDPSLPLPPIRPGAIDNPNNNPLGFTAVSFRRKAIEFGVDMTFGRNTLSLLSAYERRRAEALRSNDYRTSAMFARQLAPNLRAYVSGSFDRASGYNFVPGLIAKTIQGRAGVDYLLGRRTALSVTYTHQRVRAFPVDTRENVGALTLTRAF